MANFIKSLFKSAGYELHKIQPQPQRESTLTTGNPPPCNPVWPLPRHSNLTDDQVRESFARYELWHYAFAFEGGLAFSARHVHAGALTDCVERPLQRFRHFMPYLLEAYGGTLRGKRVLDIACNSGFWSIQCALLGAEVVGFEARPELVEQANLIKSIVGVPNVSFQVLDFWAMTPEALGGTFDVVLNLGLLYHLPKPLEVLERTKAMAREHILLDTAVHPSDNPVVHIRWEKPDDIRSAAEAGIVAVPSKTSIALMLRHIGVSDWIEIPLRTQDMPRDYLRHKRASWLIKV